jgi:hypothetical protein
MANRGQIMAQGLLTIKLRKYLAGSKLLEVF